MGCAAQYPSTGPSALISNSRYCSGRGARARRRSKASGLGQIRGGKVPVSQLFQPRRDLLGALVLVVVGERFEAAEASRDAIGELARGPPAAARPHALPIEAVVPDLGGVVEDLPLLGIAGRGEDDLLQRLAAQLAGRQQLVELVG